jgi:HD-GYP domain-containing protein (c-di-GMP phosphodiesterase class II)
MSATLTYRLTTSPKEIINLLDRSIPESNCFLWQNAGQTRKTSDFKFVNVDERNLSVQIELKSPDLDINPEDFIFLKSPVKDAAFKSKAKSVQEKHITLELPTEVVIIEGRSQVRHAFRIEDGKTIEIGEQILEVSNASQDGFALVLTPSKASALNTGDTVSVNQIGTQRLPNPISAKIVYKIPFERKNQMGKETRMKVGIQLLGLIPEPIFQAFLKRDQLIVFQDAELMKDQGFRDSVHLKMKHTMAKLSQKPLLKDLFARLAANRDSTHYLRNHIDVLCEVTCHIGKNVGWVTESTIEKLVYVSYLHDVGYFDHPRLAKIKSKRELELQKNIYTKEEQELFIKGPTYASALAHQDDDFAPDAHKILLQHKERPDGSGLPIGLKGSQLAPLSCLFMLCHEFVDYFLENENWTYSEFIAIHQRIYTGPYFHKIFQVFENLARSEK